MKPSTLPILYDSHMHTPLCRHADGMPQEYAETAVRKGLKGIIFTCHSPMPNGWFDMVRMSPDELPQYVDIVEAARQEYEDRLDVRLGLESDYFPGMEGWLEKLHDSATFHYIIGSVHYFGPEYRQAYDTGDYDDFIETYFDHLALAAESRLFDALGHADLIKNHDPLQWDFARFEKIILTALDRIAASGTAMELNTSGTLKRIPEMNPSPSILAAMCQRDIPVVLGSDSHIPERVGDGFDTALRLIQEAGFKAVSSYQYRQRTDIPLAEINGKALLSSAP